MTVVNYIILAHTNPKHLHRLIERLDQPGVAFYIHIDKRVDIKFFFLNKPNVFFLTKREVCPWGDIGDVKATINAFKQIVADKREGYCILLSGQDYPIKSNKYIRDFFATHDQTCFIYASALPDQMMPNGAIDRITLYKYNLSGDRGDYVQVPWLFSGFNRYHFGLVKKLLKRGIVPYEVLFNRKHPYITPAAGPQWFAFPVSAVKQILYFFESHPRYLSFHKHSLLPDEMAFHSVVLHLKLPLAPSVTYVNWSRFKGTRPAVFEENDLDELLNQPEGKLFARKFDQETRILDLLDDKLSHITT